MSKMLAILLAVLLTAVLSGAAVAEMSTYEEPQIQPRYDHTTSVKASLSIDGSGNATCSGSVKATSGSSKVSVAVRLKKLENGSWNTIATWSNSGSGSATVEASGSKKVPKGYSHKVVTSGTVKDAEGNVLESPSKSSETKTY